MVLPLAPTLQIGAFVVRVGANNAGFRRSRAGGRRKSTESDDHARVVHCKKPIVVPRRQATVRRFEELVDEMLGVVGERSRYEPTEGERVSVLLNATVRGRQASRTGTSSLPRSSRLPQG
jgi:hypothetical protein